MYVPRATPRKKYNPPNLAAKVLTGMHGELWIDKSSFHWVKATAHVLHPVSIEGFPARVEPGTFSELDKMPVEGGVWLPVKRTTRSSIIASRPRFIKLKAADHHAPPSDIARRIGSADRHCVVTRQQWNRSGPLGRAGRQSGGASVG